MNNVHVFIYRDYHRVRDDRDSTKHVDEQSGVAKPTPSVRIQDGNEVRDDFEQDAKAVENDHDNGVTHINSPCYTFVSPR